MKHQERLNMIMQNECWVHNLQHVILDYSLEQRNQHAPLMIA